MGLPPIGPKLTRRTAHRMARHLTNYAARNGGSYAQAYALAVADIPAGANAYGPARAASRFLGELCAAACGGRRFKIPLDPDAWMRGEWATQQPPADARETMRALAEAYGQKRWGPSFELPRFTPAGGIGMPTQAPQPAQAPAAITPAQAPQDPSAQPEATGRAQLLEALLSLIGKNGGKPDGSGTKRADTFAVATAEHATRLAQELQRSGEVDRGGMEHVDPNDPRRFDRLHHIDRAKVASGARKLRQALHASTAHRRDPDQATGRHVNRAALARLGAGATLRPFERLAKAHAPSTAVTLLLDASGSMSEGWADADGNHAPFAHNAWEHQDSRICQARGAALAVSDACGQEIALRVMGYDAVGWEIAPWGASKSQRDFALCTRYGAGGGTYAPAAVYAALQGFKNRREARRALIVFSDGDVNYADPFWEVIAEDARALNVEVYLIAATNKAEMRQKQIDTMPQSIRERARITDATGQAAADAILGACEGALRHELARMS